MVHIHYLLVEIMLLNTETYFHIKDQQMQRTMMKYESDKKLNVLVLTSRNKNYCFDFDCIEVKKRKWHKGR